MNIMRKFLAGLVALVVLWVPADLSAQRLAVWVMPRGGGPQLEQGAFAVLLNNAAELSLTREQLNRIERIRRDFAEKTERHTAQIRDAEVWGVEESDTATAAAVQRAQDEAAVLLREAEKAVDALLTEEQRTRVAELLKGESLAAAELAPVDTAQGTAGAGERKESADSDVRTMVTVDNQNYLDMSVFVYRGGQRYRLGSVSGLNTRSFALPNHVMFGITTLRFQVDPVARRNSPLSEEVVVRPGDEIIVRIPPT